MKNQIPIPNEIPTRLIAFIYLFFVFCLQQSPAQNFPERLDVFTLESFRQNFPNELFLTGIGQEPYEQRLSLFYALIDFVENFQEYEKSSNASAHNGNKGLGTMSRGIFNHTFGGSLTLKHVRQSHNMDGNYTLTQREEVLEIEGNFRNTAYNYSFYHFEENKNNSSVLKLNIQDRLGNDILYSIEQRNGRIQAEDDLASAVNFVLYILAYHINSIEGMNCGVIRESGNIFISYDKSMIEK